MGNVPFSKMWATVLQYYVIVVLQLILDQPVHGMIQCYVCSDTSTPDVDCLGTTTCGFDEICINTIRDENGAHRVTKECKQTAACNVQVSQNAHSCHPESEPSVCYYCCSEDLCNAGDLPTDSDGAVTAAEKSTTNPQQATSQREANGESSHSSDSSDGVPSHQPTQSMASVETSTEYGVPSHQPTQSMASVETSTEYGASNYRSTQAVEGVRTSSEYVHGVPGHLPTQSTDGSEATTEYVHGDLELVDFWLIWLVILLSALAVLSALLLFFLYKTCRKIREILCPAGATKDEDSKGEPDYESVDYKSQASWMSDNL